MHQTQQDILKCFVKNHNAPLSTSQVIELVYEDIFHSYRSSPNEKKDYIAFKAKLHRKALHHINKLIEQEILKIDHIGAKGQKIIVPNMLPNQEFVIRSKEKIVITNQPTPTTPLTKYKNNDFVRIFQKEQWVQRLNAILLECQFSTDLIQFQELVFDALHTVNDVVGINDFEILVQRFTISQIRNFLEVIQQECELHQKRICLIVDFTNIEDSDSMTEWITQLPQYKEDYITLIFDITSKEMLSKKKLFSHIIAIHKQHGLKFNLKNDDHHHSPYIVGRAGPYTLPNDVWTEYVSKHTEEMRGMSFAQSAVIFDLKKAQADTGSAIKIKEIVTDISKALFIANTIQRKNSLSLLKHLPETIQTKRHFLAYSQTLLRISNTFSMAKEQGKYDNIIHVLKEINKNVKAFAKQQELIYASCGMPLRFKIGLSQAYKRAHDQYTLYDEYTSISISSIQELFTKETTEMLKTIEEMAKILDGGYEVRILRKNDPQVEEIFGELSVFCSSYRLPFICYKFENKGHNHRQLDTFYREDEK